MGKVSVLCLFSVVFLVLTVACAPVYRLTSGKYQMSMQTAPGSKQLVPKTVDIMVENSQVTIKNPESDSVLRGQLEGNRFKVSSREGGQSIEFTGNLSADNQVKGDAVQKKDGKTLFNAGFELTPAN